MPLTLRFVILLLLFSYSAVAELPMWAVETADSVELCEIYASRADYAAAEKVAEGLMRSSKETGSLRDRAFASAYLGITRMRTASATT